MIAMTRGQYRRRVINRVQAALAKMPFWIILLGLLFGSGGPIFVDGKLAMGDCADCCPDSDGGMTCSDCPATDVVCEFCTDTTTPALWHITYMSVEIAMPCTDCGPYGIASGADIYFNSFGFLGTYTVDGRYFDNPVTPYGCSWNSQGPDLAVGDTAGICDGYGTPPGTDPVDCSDAYFGFTSSTTCTGGGGPFFFSGHNITIITKTAGFLNLRAVATDGPPSDAGIFGGTFFQDTIAADDCCTDYLFTNQNTDYSCPVARAGLGEFGGTDGVFGINGFASVSVC